MNLRKGTRVLLMGFLSVITALMGTGQTASGMARADAQAIKGYDAVAYFTEGRAAEGSASFGYAWHGMTWQFTTQANRDLFAGSPEKYAPQYDGYCAWAMTSARKAHTDPEIWKIVDGKLYLNCSRSAYEKWSRDIPGNIKKADENWKKLSGGN